MVSYLKAIFSRLSFRQGAGCSIENSRNIRNSRRPMANEDAINLRTDSHCNRNENENKHDNSMNLNALNSNISNLLLIHMKVNHLLQMQIESTCGILDHSRSDSD